jgi:hypothetical protein
LTEVTLPEGIKYINNSTFDNCSALTHIPIPASVISIANSAFGNCTSLTEIVFEGSAPSFTGMYVFKDVTATAYYPAADATWTEDVRQNYGGTITWVAVLAPAMMHGISATYKGKVQLNFYLKLPEYVLADSNAYVVISGSGDSDTIIKLVAEAPINEKDGVIRRHFVYDVVAKKFGDDITLNLYLGDGTHVPLIRANGEAVPNSGYVYSVTRYIEAILNSSTNQKMRALAQAMKEYGEVAQIYFGYKAEGITVSSTVTGITSDQLEQYAPVKDANLIEGLTGVTMTLVFEADNTFRLYYKYEEGVDPYSYSYAIDGNTAVLRHNSKGYYVEIPNIAAKKLGTTHEFTITKNGNTYHWSGSALTYARGLTLTSAENSQNLGKVLYVYYQAAHEYFGD